ncbi:MAG: hypothetical protein ABR501_01725 [Pyrinomonadaceae bacterium]
MAKSEIAKGVLLVSIALLIAGCAALQPPATTGPRANEPPYPVLFKEDITKRDVVMTVVNRLSPQSGASPVRDLELQPVTATIASLPAVGSSPLYLPKVGAQPVMNEEETRESLRRFIKEWQQLIGADPDKLSLVERVDQPDGSKLALYEQRPFRYPIRGNYGKLRIHFATDRRILNISSTCIPDADRIQTALAAMSVRIKAEEAINKLNEAEVAYTDANGNKLSIKQPHVTDGKVLGLVIYIVGPKTQTGALEFHIAWEMELDNASVKTAYVDAVTGEIFASQ